MNRKDSRNKLNWIVRFTGGGILLMAIIGLIIFSPLSAGEQDTRHADEYIEAGEVGGHHLGAVHAGPLHLGIGPEKHIAFLEIVLDLSASQVKEIEPILAEQHEKIAEFRAEGRMHSRRAARMKRMHRADCCDTVDRTEMRAKMRRQRREFERDREKVRKRIERNREELEEKLTGVLDDGQMKKYRKLRELRNELREERQDHREERRERRSRKS